MDGASSSAVVPATAPKVRSTPQPGDGAYLAQSSSRPGDGRYLTNGHRHPQHTHSPHPESSHRGGLRGRGRGCGGRPGAQGQSGDAGGFYQDYSANGRSAPAPTAPGPDASRVAPTSGGGTSRQTHRPQQPREIVVAPQSMSSHAEPNGCASASAGPAQNFKPSRSRHRRQAKSNGTNPTAPLDPTVAVFVPTTNGAPLPANGPSALSRPASPVPNGSTKPRSRKSAKFKAPPVPISQPPAHKSSRRAAFDKQTKLSTADKSADGATSPSVHSVALSDDREEVQSKKANGRAKKEEKDDLVSRLTRGLKSRPYLECPICFNSINPAQPIWSCLPPTTPPPPPTFPDEIPINPTQHYTSCYTPFHLSCIRDWANRSLVEERERARGFGKDEDDVTWRCPGCQKRRKETVGGYKCFCGRVSGPPFLGGGVVPHSCGEACSRKRPGCDHVCPLPCHPGPCPPCQVALIVPCPSHHTALTVKCAVATSNNAAMTPVCDEVCDRSRDCGNTDHACKELCHYGPCSPCNAVETVQCYCGDEVREVPCGWSKHDEKICGQLSAEGGEAVWKGRFNCGMACKGVYSCGIHPCEQTCHPHPVKPLECPFSPSKITHCACGLTPLSRLPDPPRADCLAPIPTCGQRCPKSRPCGHQCTLTCHNGDCPPCHEEVVRPCRCGESVLVIACDELREKAESGEGVLCEKVCKALRNCGRHECGRICCPLSYLAKNRKKRLDEVIGSRLDEVHDQHECHLTCGRLLSCGIHTCQKKDHKGACGRCLQASFDELICHCGHTVVYPPVACGTTITCLYPCARPPPPCGHPRTPHQCHENPACPPCPYLVQKPCACGKDSAVKNIRCSQDKVSCGQQCNELLSCGYHRCMKSCHAPGECGDCNQTCGKAKRICGHPCTASCHAPAKCPESDPCQAIITMSCACGHVQQRTSCGASTTNPTSREKNTLKCNSECAVRQRNARLADALGISASREGKVGEVEWEAGLKDFGRANVGFVKIVEGTLDSFVKGGKTSMVLPYMPLAKRTFVISLCGVYRLGHELVDQEPNRSVMIRRKIDTRIPSPLLSSICAPQQKNLGGLTNLRQPPPAVVVPKASWGQVKGGSMAAVVAGPNSHPHSRTASPSGTGGIGGSGRATTPVAPMASAVGAAAASSTLGGAAGGGVRVEKVVGEVGKVDEGDWDVSDAE